MKIQLTSTKGKMLMHRELIKLYQERMSNPFINFELQVLKIGDAIVIGIPGELFSELGLEIKDVKHINPLPVFRNVVYHLER